MAVATRSTVVGIFDNPEQAERAVAELRSAGFGENDVSLVRRRNEGEGALANVSAGPHARETHWEEGAATGAMAGGVTGGLVGMVLAAGILPGVGAVLVGGPLTALLFGATTGAMAGGVIGALIGLGVPEKEAVQLHDLLREGRTLVAVRAEDRYSEALAILSAHGGHDLERMAESAGRR
jgi:outer membrane lipoprotein SlyB